MNQADFPEPGTRKPEWKIPQAHPAYIEALAPLAMMPFADTITAAGWNEVARALERSCHSPEHAYRVCVDFAFRAAQGGPAENRVPNPYHLSRHAATVSPRRGPDHSCPRPCSECAGSPGYRLILKPPGGVFSGEPDREYRDFCPCPAGQWRRAWAQAKGAA